MQFNQAFDARSVEPTVAFQPLTPGDYKVSITGSEPKQTKDGSGGYLELTLTVMEGQYQGRTLLYRLNLWNNNTQASEIAYRQLSALCHVTGVFNLQASEQLHGIPFVAVVAISKNDPNYNEVKGVRHLDGSQPGKGNTANVASGVPTAPAQPAMPAPQMPPQNAAPWGAAPAQQQPAPAAPWGQQPAAPQMPPQAPPNFGPPQFAPPAQPQMPQQMPPQQAPAAPWGAPQQQQPQQQPAAAPWGAAPAQQAAPPWAQK